MKTKGSVFNAHQEFRSKICEKKVCNYTGKYGTHNGLICNACKESKVYPDQDFSVAAKLTNPIVYRGTRIWTVHKKIVLKVKTKLQPKEEVECGKTCDDDLHTKVHILFAALFAAARLAVSGCQL